MGEKLIEWAKTWAEGLGPWGYVLLVFAALVEYVFPPFPGDSVVVVGGAFALRTPHSWLGVWLAVTLGNVLGIALQHRLGHALAQRAQGEPGWVARRCKALGLTPARMEAMQAHMQRRGAVLLVLNRFLPSFRALVFLAAGALGMSFCKTMAWGVLGSLAWSAFLLGVGALLGGNAEKMLEVLEGYQRAAAWALGAALVLWVLWRFIKKRPPKGAA